MAAFAAVDDAFEAMVKAKPKRRLRPGGQTPNADESTTAVAPPPPPAPPAPVAASEPPAPASTGPQQRSGGDLFAAPASASSASPQDPIFAALENKVSAAPTGSQQWSGGDLFAAPASASSASPPNPVLAALESKVSAAFPVPAPASAALPQGPALPATGSKFSALSSTSATPSPLTATPTLAGSSKAANVAESPKAWTLGGSPKGGSPRVTLHVANELGKTPEEVELAMRKRIFAMCDRGGLDGGDGQISRRELTKACKHNKEVAEFLGLPSNFSSAECQRILDDFFKGTDADGDNLLTFAEFQVSCNRVRSGAPTGSPIPTPTPPPALAPAPAPDKLLALEARVEMMEKKLQEQEDRWQQRQAQWEEERKRLEAQVGKSKEPIHFQETKFLLKHILETYEKEGSCPLCQTLAATPKPVEVNHDLKLQCDPSLLTPGLISLISELGQVALVEQMSSDPKWFSLPRVKALRGRAKTVAALVMAKAGSLDEESAALVRAELEK